MRGIGVWVVALTVCAVIFWIFFPWATLLSLSSGDWPYLFSEQIWAFSWFPQAQFLWLAPYYQIVTKFVVTVLGVRWEIAEKLLWFFPFVLISAVASFKAFRSWIAVLVYTTNTYILMIVGGGQMGVAMAYALAPWVFRQPTFLSIAIVAIFDPRITLLTVVASLFVTRPKVKKLLLSLLGVFVIHLYWIIPLVRSPSVIGERLSEVSTGILEFLSFATFSQTISLLHPNWPENIFGKVYFMRTEFLLVPIIAFSVFIFGDQKQKRLAIPYGFLALVGAFLAKGTQEPFGEIYTWLFTYVPGFWLFRDSTKFYLWIALAYAYLISKSKIPSILVIFIWAILIRQAILHQLPGTFQPKPVDSEYFTLKERINTSPIGESSYWFPSVSRYGFSSAEHPAISGQIGDNGYVVVPADTRQEIFQTERAYDDSKRLELIASLSALPNLIRDPKFTNLAVWRIK